MTSLICLCIDSTAVVRLDAARWPAVPRDWLSHEDLKLFESTSKCNGLFLTPLIRRNQTALARKLSAVDESLFLGHKSHAGFIRVNDKYNSNLYFWFFPVKDMARKPWIIWLQGGPGYSSLFGLFELIGPVMIQHGQVHARNISWTSDYSVLFLDNPVGAGFSFTESDDGYPTLQKDVARDMYKFLKQFLKIFPELRIAPLFIAGQSYAGKYVPALAYIIHQHKENNGINLRGISIGNGMIDLWYTMHYAKICKAFGLIEEPELTNLEDIEESALDAIYEGRYVDASNYFNETIEYIKAVTGVTIYNILKDPNNNPYEFEAFLNRADVRKAIHVGNCAFNLNNQLVYQKMLPDISQSVKRWVEELLEEYGVLFYSGQLDLILPYGASKYLFEELEWSGKSYYEDAPRVQLRKNRGGAIVGYMKSGGNFTEVLVRGAGHAVPKDKPEVAKFLIDSFIRKYS